MPPRLGGGIMRRREFLGFASGAAVWPIASQAQDLNQIRRLGILLGGTADDPLYKTYVATFTRRLQALGWEEGRNIRIDTRASAADPTSTRTLAAEIVAQNPDVILASGA